MKPNSNQLNSMQSNETLRHETKYHTKLRIGNIWGVSRIHWCLSIVLKTVLFINIARPWEMLHAERVNSVSTFPTIGPITMTMWAVHEQVSMEKGPIHPTLYTLLHLRSISIFCHMLLSESTWACQTSSLSRHVCVWNPVRLPYRPSLCSTQPNILHFCNSGPWMCGLGQGGGKATWMQGSNHPV